MGREVIVRAVVIAPSAATESYLRIKTKKAEEAGMYLELIRMENDASADDILHKILLPGADAIIMQLPLPSAMNERAVLDAIPVGRDADVLSSTAYKGFLSGEADALLPPVVCAVSEILERANITVGGKRAIVIGNGRLVGAPVQAWLTREGAEVSVLTHEDFNEKKSSLKEAEIVVSGAGSPHLVTPDMLTSGVVCIDAGTSESNGAIVGDFDPACVEIASTFTPVPGGVGPVAVACLFKNVAELLR
jgi:methylenetetrahydrofolate dehydrogenase (NADP+)/methenyltetrahydrofolate cyclohydrolase